MKLSKHWIIEGINEWRQLWGSWNWISCTFVQIYFEKDSMTHGYEFMVILLGLGIRIRYNTDRALAQFDRWTREIEIEDEDVVDLLSLNKTVDNDPVDKTT